MMHSVPCPRCSSVELGLGEYVCDSCAQEIAECLARIYGQDVDWHAVQAQGEAETRAELHDKDQSACMVQAGGRNVDMAL